MQMLIESARLGVQTFNSAEEFLGSRRPDVPSCLVLDVRLPNLSGPDLQQELAKTDVPIPIMQQATQRCALAYYPGKSNFAAQFVSTAGQLSQYRRYEMRSVPKIVPTQRNERMRPLD